MVVNIRNFLCGCKGCLHGDGPCVNEVCPQDWWAYDLKNKKYVNPILDTWNVQLTCKIPLFEQNANYWLEQIQELSKIVSYRTLQDHIETNPLPHLIFKRDIIMSESDKSNLDFVALHHFPSDVPDSFAPVSVLGDGNCFCRAVSYLLFRNESRHAEIRTRIVYEAVNNMAHYLDKSYVQQGANHLYR